MTANEFHELFLRELSQNHSMNKYYKFLSARSKGTLTFRKNYFLRRLSYISDHLEHKPESIWDCGCGYGTTALFLAMNGIRVTGSTFEFYSREIERRKAYWNQFGNADLFQVRHENIFDAPPEASSFDAIIVQDTLHHLEPIDDAFDLLARSLRPKGKVIVVDENGQNIIACAKLYVKRGNRRIISIYDEKLEKEILIGNENTRSMAQWGQIAKRHDLAVSDVEYNRLFLPPTYWLISDRAIRTMERFLSSSKLLTKYLFWGLNFTLTKKSPS